MIGVSPVNASCLKDSMVPFPVKYIMDCVGNVGTVFSLSSSKTVDSETYYTDILQQKYFMSTREIFETDLLYTIYRNIKVNFNVKTDYSVIYLKVAVEPIN